MTNKIKAYVALARLEKPVGIWLVFLPALMGLSLAAHHTKTAINLREIGVFFLGALLVRSAGCTINDILDRHFDGKVERTRGRPLPSGRLSLLEALLFLGVQCALALCLLPFLKMETLLLMPVAALLAGTYPLFKRFTYLPQLYLGLAMNFSAVMAYMQGGGTQWLTFSGLYGALIFWTLMYDTLYGHMDKRDDVKAGVKSLSLTRFGGSKAFLYLCILMMTALMILVLYKSPLSLVVLAGTQIHMINRIKKEPLEGPLMSMNGLLSYFKSHVYYGFLLWVSIVLL